MTKSNRKSQAKKGKGDTTLALVKKENVKMSQESDLQYQDRVRYLTLKQLIEKKDKTADEQKEHDQLYQLVGVAQMYSNGSIPTNFADTDLKGFTSRIHEELADQFGTDTAMKRILIGQITSAWSMYQSYERIFSFIKYEKTEDGKFKWHISHERTGMMKEARKGMETSTNLILRLTQALQNIVQPPMQVKATNAFFAQNQQVNQNVAPKDLDKYSDQNNEQAGT